MYTMKKALPKRFGAVLGWLFALFAVLASFGIGNMTQANSISSALNETVGFSKVAIGVVLTILSLAVIVGGIKSISKVSSVVVPLMAVFYIIAGIIVIIGNIQNIPAGLVMIFKYAFAPQAIIGAASVALLVVVALAVGLVTHPIRTLALVFHKLAALAAGLALILALIVWFWYDHSKPDFVPCFWGSIGVIVASILIRTFAEWILERPTRPNAEP